MPYGSLWLLTFRRQGSSEFAPTTWSCLANLCDERELEAVIVNGGWWRGMGVRCGG